MVAIEYRHPIEMVREHPSGHQAPDTATNNNGVLTETIGHQASPCARRLAGAVIGFILELQISYMLPCVIQTMILDNYARSGNCGRIEQAPRVESNANAPAIPKSPMRSERRISHRSRRAGWRIATGRVKSSAERTRIL
jgi:hypothetical protein